MRQILTYSTFQITFWCFSCGPKRKCSFLSVLQLCAGEEGVYIPWPQLRFPSMVPRICSVLTVLKVNKNHLLPLYRYLEVLNKAKCASVGRSNCIKRVNGTGSFISTLPMHSGSEKVSMSRHVGLIRQLRAGVCPIRCSFVVVSRSSAQRVKQHPRGHHKWPKSDFFFFPSKLPDITICVMPKYSQKSKDWSEA